MKKLILTTLPLTLAFTACQRPGDEFREALPHRSDVTVAFPEDAAQSSQGLSRQALVGEPAEYYTTTYYEARKINGFGAFVVNLVETITAYPPTTLDADVATWGPFSDDREPNEFRLTVERRDAPSLHYLWYLEGRPKSATDYTGLAGGAFEPSAVPDQGRGWFGVSFDNIRTLDPTEDGAGQIAYAFAKDDEGLAVQVVFQGLDATGAVATAGYLFGQRTTGEGFVSFAFPGDINDGDPTMPAQEDILLLSRWTASGAGRADIIATNGDLGTQALYGAQCWNDTFVSTFEAIVLDENILNAQGDPTSCRLGELQPESLPDAESLVNPYAEELE